MTCAICFNGTEVLICLLLEIERFLILTSFKSSCGQISTAITQEDLNVTCRIAVSSHRKALPQLKHLPGM